MSERRIAPPPTRFGPGSVRAHPGRPHIVQRASLAPGASGASDAFRQSAMALNTEADGSQAARIKLVALDMRPSPAKRLEFETSHIYYPQTGPHSEAVVMDAALTWLIQHHVPSLSLRLCQVQLYTRFNPCPTCADRIVAFRSSLLQRARNGVRPTFHLLYSYKTYFGPGGTWSAAEGIFQRQAASTTVRQGGWVVTDGLTNPVVYTGATLGTAADPITLG
jgi:hypothetical protein